LLSPADMLLIGAAALIFFGPDQLPKVAKRAGQVVREVQNTSQSFIREMERAADDVERRERHAAESSSPTVSEPIEAPHESHHNGEAAPDLRAEEPIEIIEADPEGPEPAPKPATAQNFEI